VARRELEGAASATLASGGGSTAREQSWIVPLSDVLVDDEIEQAVMEAVRSGWWSMGPRVGRLELEFARFCGTRHALAVANGTAALHLALLAARCGPGDEVLLASLNFVAAANAIRHTGAEPVFCDIEGVDELNVSPADLEAAIGPRTRAIVVMHYGGNPCRMDAILGLAESRGLTVIEDAAHAPGARWRDRLCGTIASVGCFSFFSNKNLPVGEGGMIVTDDDAIAARIRLLRSHGMTTLTWDRHRGHASSYDVVAQGFNYRMDELHAAIALVQLGRLEQQNAARARIVDFYREALDRRNGMTIAFARQTDVTPAHHLSVLVLPEGHQRDDFRAALAERGIQTSVHYPPIHRFSAYRQLASRRSLPVTEAVEPRLVTLPLYPHMSDDDVCAVTEAVVAAT
jgi:dTDP-4-amino-4,6-dideoxygalactose transaminase